MSKPPNDGNPSAVGGLNFSDRRRKNKGGRTKTNSNLVDNSKTLPDDILAPAKSRQATSAAKLKPYNSSEKRREGEKMSNPSADGGLVYNYQADRSSQQNQRSAEKNYQAMAEEREPAHDNYSANASSKDPLNPAKSSKNQSDQNSSGVRHPTVEGGVGYGIDAKALIGAGNQYARSKRNRRPGRHRAQSADKVIYPPKPNRRNHGLENKSNSAGKKEPGAKKFANSGGGKIHWSQAKGLGPLYAALDLGTNNCRLLVALPQQVGRFRVVDAFSRIVRLGKGMEGSGRLDEDAMGRAVEALGECARKLKNSNIRKMRLIATEACRRAENGAQFLGRVKRETGLDLEIVDRQTEAYLAAEGCGALVDKKADGAVLFDIGGGSSELILLDRRGRKNRKISEQVSSWTSLPVGVVTLSERHGGRQVSRQMFDAMVGEVEGHLNGFEGRHKLHDVWGKGRVHLLGTSGTVTTLAGMHLKLPRYDRRQVDGIWLSDGDVDGAIENLLEMDYHQRAANPCIGSERADLVLAGCAILQAIRNAWPSPRLRVADRGLREGILTQMMNQDGAWITPKRGRKNSANRSKHFHQQVKSVNRPGKADGNG